MSTKDRAWLLVSGSLLAASALAVLCTIAMLRLPDLRSAVRLDPGRAHAYEAGDKIDVPRHLLASGTPTLILFSRSESPACEANKAPLKRVLLAVRMAVKVHILVPRMSARELQYGKDIGLEPASIIAVPQNSFRVRAVPTLLLVRPDGTIEFSQQGTLTAAHEASLIQMIDTATTVGRVP